MRRTEADRQTCRSLQSLTAVFLRTHVTQGNITVCGITSDRQTDRQPRHRTRHDNRRTMHNQVTTTWNALRFKVRLPHWCSLQISTIPIDFAALHCLQAVMITLTLMSQKHDVGVWSEFICLRARISGVLWSTRRLPFGFHERRRIFLHQFSVPQFLKDSGQARRCSGIVM